ncbi:MAG: GlsB/YeaQ/YmgE family stress response membrane protein [Bryobacteraceae bacterium]|nr:GlsB/YeaQ/YmgE family stress response membrane protein [Bryobacteraceae bacterium]
MSGFISWIVFGLVVGVIAKFMMPGRDPGGFVVTILLGIAGAIVGGWISTMLGTGVQGDSAGWIMSILGAVALLGLYRLFASPGRVA